MHTKSIVALALVAGASVAVAESQDRPKFYFPRQVKRVFTNTTIPVTSPASQSSNSPDLTTTSSSTKRDTISDILSSLLGGKDTSSDEESTTTIVMQSTVFVSPSPTGSRPQNGTDPVTTPTPTKESSSEVEPSNGGSTPKPTPSEAEETTTTKSPWLTLPTISLPTISLPLGNSDSSTPLPISNATSSVSTESTDTATPSETSTDSTSSGIILFPTGVVTTTSTSTPTTTSSSTGGLLDGITSAIETLLPTLLPPSANSTTITVSESATTELPTQGTPTETATTEEPTQGTPTETVTSSSTTGLIDIITSLIPLPTTTNSTDSSAPSATPITTTSSGLIDIITSLIPLPTSSSNGTESSASVTPTFTPTSSTPVTTPPISDITETPTISVPITETPTISVPITVTPTISSTPTSSIPGSSGNVTVPTTSSSLPPISSSSSVTVLPTSSGISSNTSSTASSSTPPPPPITSSTIIPVPSNTTVSTTEPTSTPLIPSTTLPLTPSDQVTPTPTPTPTPEPTPTESSSKSLQTSIVPTGIITDSQSWLPTSLIVQESTSTVNTGGIPTTSTGLPDKIPMAISPAETSIVKPPDSTMIQISFRYGEHYLHLVENPKAAAQLFQILPYVLAYGGSLRREDIVMFSIRPYDTSSTLGYITSQAILYYPTSRVNQLADDVKTPNSPLYNQVQSLYQNLTDQINPAIPIWIGAGLEGNPNIGSGGDSDSDTNPNHDPFGGSGGGEQTTAAQKGTTAGIAIGALSVAGAYGAAMFVIARRYKRKKQRHQRSSSISAADEMRQAGSPALMGGALLSRDFSNSPGSSPGYGAMNGGNMRDSQGSGRSGTNTSARTANISAPVAAENSLGWN